MWVVDLTLASTWAVLSIAVLNPIIRTRFNNYQHFFGKINFGTMDSGSSPSRRGETVSTSQPIVSQGISWDDLKLMIDGENVRYASY